MILDTAERNAFVEAWHGDDRLGRRDFGTARHAQELTRSLKELLAEIRWAPAEIQAVAVNLGPGSFTGIRVGLALAKALVYVRHIPLIGVDAFDAWAAGLDADKCDHAMIVMEGQLQTCHFVPFVLENRSWHRGELASVPKARMAELLAGQKITSPSQSLRELLVAQCQILEVQPRIDIVAKQRLREQRFENAMSLEPFYVRPSSAEEKWDQRPTA